MPAASMKDGELSPFVQSAIHNNAFSSRIVFENSSDAILMVDVSNGELVDANPIACQMLGFPYQRLVRMNMRDFYPDEMPALMSFVDSVKEKGHGWTDGLTCQTAGGIRIPS